MVGRFFRSGTLLTLVGIAACSGGGPSGETPERQPLTQRQRDSIVGASALPGARAVRNALEASDRVADRAARLDSLQR